MLKAIKFKTDYRCFKEGTEFTFSSPEPRFEKSGLNLVVGDNGCGKSTLLKLLASNDTEVLEFDADFTESYFLDLEFGNLRVVRGDIKAHQVASLFMSHGESNNALLKTINRIPSSSCVLIDEPDMALSIRSISRLYKTLRHNARTKQIICSVHNPLLISYVDEVLSLEHGKWMSSQEFIELSKE